VSEAIKKKNEKQLKETGKPMLLGNWRMEISPGAPRKDDVFLHVIHVGDQSLQAMCESRLLKTAGRIGVELKLANRTAVVVFATHGGPAGHVRIASGDDILVDRDLTDKVMPQSGLGAHGGLR